ncbi:myb [Trichoderma arundinaceum]|uniref:Myb n=1 Tax=Trichoderma arundinaceum TaxID=490622 RepID=A0A395NAH1_TRIAR|nr:myb [Trichoderma arundinaceum]
MLLPSAFSCDGSQTAPLARSQTGRFVSPPASPTTLSAQYSIDNIMNTCRSLQSLISMTTSNNDHGALAPAPTLTQLPTPPLAYAPTPMKLRLRSRANKSENKGEETPIARRRIAKRAPPRGVNKRRRVDDDDMGRNDESDMDTEAELDTEALQMLPSSSSSPQAPSTPKRARISPEQLPLGLERSDFHNMHLLEDNSAHGQDSNKSGTDVQVETDGTEWSVEDDRVLVELVLEKLKLSKMEWQDCARSLGKDRHSVNRRWKSLIMNGDVGVKTRSRRARIHSTWR